MARQTVAATTVIGTQVVNWHGDVLGTITDFTVNKFDGSIAYLVLSYAGDYGFLFPDKRFAVPFAALARKRATDGAFQYILNVEPGYLDQFPGFEQNDWPDFADPHFVNIMDNFYRTAHLDICA